MISTTSWPGANEVHVWQSRLDADESELSDLRGYLSVDERARAERYRHERDARRYTAAHGWLRYLLTDYTGDDPRDLVFVQGEHGKLRLFGAIGESLRFNMSHSEDIAVYAVARGREVGVDIEQVQGSVPIQVVHRYFSDTEQDALAALPEHLQLRGFFECWTRKEAQVKAMGVGLSGLARAHIHAHEWSLHSIDVGPDYVAALAIAGSACIPAAATSLTLDKHVVAATRLRQQS
jgi:4'-phosphopantetheinyl transferase